MYTGPSALAAVIAALDLVPAATTSASIANNSAPPGTLEFPVQCITSMVNEHPMQTRINDDIRVPRDYLILQASKTSTISPVPKTYRGALTDPHWHAIMVEEFNALTTNRTWDLVSPPLNMNNITGKWVYRYKLNLDNSLAQYKAL